MDLEIKLHKTSCVTHLNHTFSNNIMYILFTYNYTNTCVLTSQCVQVLNHIDVMKQS